MTRLDTLFFDVGGVCLTNGWDTDARLATINNESREMNRHRIDTFGLGQMFSAFFSSCYLGVRKPDARIYEIALDVMQADPAASLFVDDREENVAGARAVGLRAIHAPEPGRLVAYLRNAGVEASTERDGERGDANDHEETA